MVNFSRSASSGWLMDMEYRLHLIDLVAKLQETAR